MTTTGEAMWAKLDDKLPRHPKVVELPYEARWLYVVLLCYSAEHLTDGRVPVGAIDAELRPYIDQLVTAQLVTRNRNGLHIHDWLDWNPAADTVRQRRKAETERKRRRRRGEDGRYGDGEGL